jgi:hypothetical protein
MLRRIKAIQACEPIMMLAARGVSVFDLSWYYFVDSKTVGSLEHQL